MEVSAGRGRMVQVLHAFNVRYMELLRHRFDTDSPWHGLVVAQVVCGTDGCLLYHKLGIRLSVTPNEHKHCR